MEQLSEHSSLRAEPPVEDTNCVTVMGGGDAGLGVSGSAPINDGEQDVVEEETKESAGSEEQGLLSSAQTVISSQVPTSSFTSTANSARNVKYTPSPAKIRSSVTPTNPTRTATGHTSPRGALVSNSTYYRCFPIQNIIASPNQAVYYQQQPPASATRPHHQQPGLHGSEQLSSTNLYIRGLSRVCSDEDLMQLCKGFGRIVSTKSILDKNTSLCKGYGFVDFENPSDAMRACQSLQAQGIIVQFAKVPQQDQDPTNLYMSNLPADFDEKMIENILSPYGKIVSTRILRDQGMNSRGVGFARMDSKDSCDKIIEKLNGAMLPGGKEPLMIKFADSSNKKKQTQNRWRDVQQPYIYETTQVIPQTGLVGSRGLVQTGVFTAPYVQTSAQPIQGYQVPVSTISGGWSPATYFVHPTAGVGSTDGVHALSAQMGGLQIASTTGYVPSNQYHFTNQAGGTTYAQPSPGSWTLPSGAYVQQEHSAVDPHTATAGEPARTEDHGNTHLYYPTSTWSGK